MKKWNRPIMHFLTSAQLSSSITAAAFTCLRKYIR